MRATNAGGSKTVYSLLALLFSVLLLGAVVFVRVQSARRAEVDTVAPLRALEWLRGGTAVFLDARPEPAYQYRHIPGAISVPVFLSEPEMIRKQLSSLGLPKDTLVVTYCDAAECGLAGSLAKNLRSLGYTSVYVLLGGIDRWVELGYPTESGAGGSFSRP